MCYPQSKTKVTFHFVANLLSDLHNPYCVVFVLAGTREHLELVFLSA